MDLEEALTPPPDAPPLSSEWLRSAALGAGFDLCGFARPAPIPPEHLLSWMEAGFGADMDWMAERLEARLDVRRLVPGARTVVALACNYFVDDEGSEGSPIARCARGRDYHATMRDRLRALRRALVEARPGMQTYAAVDAGAVMEKVWAVRAGLGYVGKNGCLITPRFGSYVVLAAMVLDAAVDAYSEDPAPDRCGGCTLCITACPTAAIVAERVVDARACISYQTIENRRGVVPEPIREQLEEWVFGCDICQDVCPLNRAPLPAGERFLPRAVSRLGPLELAALTPEEYQTLIPGTALARAQYGGLRRNAAYALGAAGERAAIPLLRRLTGDPDARVQEAALWALGRLGEALQVPSPSRQPGPGGADDADVGSVRLRPATPAGGSGGETEDG